MRIDGIQLSQGSSISNLVVASGTSFPSQADVGEMFYRTDADLNMRGLYCYIGSSWDRISSTASTTVPVGTTLPSSAVTGDLFYLDTNNSFEGLYAYTGVAWALTGNAASVSYTITGDVNGTIDGGTDSLSLANVNASPQTDVLRKITVSSKGLVTATSAVQPSDITTALGYTPYNATNPVGYLINNETITVSGDASGSGTTSIALTLASVGTAGVKGSASSVPVFTTDAKGRVTANTDTAINIAASQVGSGTFADGRIAATNVTQHEAALVLAASQITSGSFTDARVAQSNVTQHQAALTILESQITDGALLARVGGNETITGTWTFNNSVSSITPTTGSHLTTKAYVDSVLAGLSWKQPVKVATTANITLSGAQTIDGNGVIAGDRVLVKDQTVASQNGVYVVATGAWTRATDFDNTAPIDEVNSAAVFVMVGANNADTGWTQSAPVTTIGTDAMTFIQFSASGSYLPGAGLVLNGKTFDVVSADIGRIVVGVDSIDLATVGSAGTYKSVTTDAYGRVTGGTNPTTLAGYGISDAQALDADLTAIAALNSGNIGLLRKTAPNTWTLDTSAYLTSISSGDVTTALGFTPYNATNPNSYISGNQTITLSGDATGSGTTAITVTLANVATAGTYKSVTINAKGLVTGGTNPTTLAGYGIADAQPLDGDLTAIAALAGASGMLIKTAANTWALDTSAYLTAVTSGQITAALGFTPYNATNPAGYTTNTGTVTTASVVSANGFAGTVATAGTTPAITLTTSVTGVLKGNGTAISAATAGTDYSAGTAALGTGILKSTTTTGALTIAVAADFPTLNQNTTGSAALNVLKVGDTMTGDLTLTGTTAKYVIVNPTTNGLYSGFVTQYNGANRWGMYKDTTLETGSATGSNFVIARYSDAGTLVDAPLNINRATGLTTLSSLTVSGALTGSLTGHASLDLPLTGGTLTGGLTLAYNSALITLDTTTAATNALLAFKQSGVNRWIMFKNGTAETGTNTGSNFSVQRYDDAGTLIDAPFTINRATGVTTLASLFVSGTMTGTLTGSAASLTTSRNFSVSGDATTAAGVAFNGSANVDLPITLASVGTAGTKGSASSVPVFVTDAKGRVTSNVDTAIAIAASQTTSGTFADARIAASNVTQHQASLAILETQITAGTLLARVGDTETITGNWTHSGTLTAAEPTLSGHVATKNYVDNAVLGLTWKAPVVAATTANITLSAPQTIDGIAVVAGNRVLVKDQTTTSQNGVYVVAAGAWTRATDFDAVSPIDEVNSAAVFVKTGTVNADTGWTQASVVATIGTDPITFVQFTAAGAYTWGNGLVATGNVVNVVGNAGRIVANANDIDLATVGTAITDSFKKITTDAYGRVTASSAVVAADITGISGLTTTIGSTAIALGSSATTIAGLTSVTSTTFVGALTGHASLDLPLTGGLMSGNLTILTASGDTLFGLHSTAATNYAGVLMGKGGVGRWLVAKNTTAEGGSNTGSNFQITRYNDAGTIIDNPFSIARDTGNATFLATVTAAGFSGPLAGAVTGNVTGSASLNVLKTGDTMTGNLVISTVAAGTSTQLSLSAPTSFGAYYHMNTSGSGRWTLGKSSAVEAGANAGSDFFVQRYSDAGAIVDTPLTINRATGLTTLSSLTVTGALTASGGITGTITGASSLNVLKAGDTMTGQLNLSYASARIFINPSAAGQNAGVFITTGGSNRWHIIKNSTAESGANAGSDLNIVRSDDTGVGIDTPLSISRATGLTTLTSLTVSGAMTGSLTGASSLNVLKAGDAMTDALTITNSSNTLKFLVTATNSNAGTTAQAVIGVNSDVGGLSFGANSSTFVTNGYGAAGEAFVRSSAASSGLFIVAGAAVPVRFGNNGGEKMRIDASGNVGIGTVSPQVNSLSVSRGIGAGNLSLQSATTPTAADQRLFMIGFGSDTDPWKARVEGWSAGAWTTTTNTPTNLVFHTTPVGSATPTERMRIDAAGSVGIGGVPTAGRSLDIIKNPTGATNAVGVLSGGVVQSDVTSSWSGFTAFPSVAAATFTVGALNHFYAQQNVIGAGSAVTNQFGFRVDGTLTGATNNYAFYSAIAAGANRYNLYMQGTADNYLAGALGIGAVPGSVVGLRVSKNITGAATAYGVLLDSTIQSDVTGSAIGIRTSLSTAATAFNITGLQHFRASLASQGAGSTLSTQYGFIADSSLVGATTNYGFYSDLPIGAGNYNFYANSTAKSYFGGNVGIGSGKTSPATALDVNGTVTSTAVSINGVGLVDSTTLTTSVATTDQVLDTNAITAIRAVKYQITVNSGAAYSYTEVRVLHDGTNVYMSETNTMNSGAALATFNADINAGNLRLLTTPVNAVTTYKVVAIAVAV